MALLIALLVAFSSSPLQAQDGKPATVRQPAKKFFSLNRSSYSRPVRSFATNKIDTQRSLVRPEEYELYVPRGTLPSNHRLARKHHYRHTAKSEEVDVEEEMTLLPGNDENVILSLFGAEHAPASLMKDDGEQVPLRAPHHIRLLQ